MKKVILVCCVTLFSLLMINSVQAQGAKVAVGLGAAAVPEYEGSDDYEGAPLIFLNARWDNNMSISVLGSHARINLVPHQWFRAGLVGEYIPDREDTDTAAVNALPDVDSSFMAGGFLGLEYNGWNGSIEVMTDVADGNDGTLARFRAGYGTQVNPAVNLNLGIFTTWADDDYMDAYFTVTTAGAAASGLTAYAAESGLKDVGASLSLHYTPWQKWGIMGLLMYKKLLGDAEDSPIVDNIGEDGQATIGAMLTYRF